MEKLITLQGIAAPIMRANIDTDQIIPIGQLMFLAKTGYGKGLFAEWRYKKLDGEGQISNPEFILNRAPYCNATILLAGLNFACGSSREAAVWALRDFGIRCVIAPSFGHIFYANCFKSSVLPVMLPQEQVEELARQVEAGRGGALITVDLENCRVIAPDGQQLTFSTPSIYRHALLEGLDNVEAALKFESEISVYSKADRKRRPWIY